MVKNHRKIVMPRYGKSYQGVSKGVRVILYTRGTFKTTGVFVSPQG
jgi:hypothetical protein